MSVTGSVRVHAKKGKSGEESGVRVRQKEKGWERKREREKARENTSCGWLSASGSLGGSPRRGQNAPVVQLAIKSSNCFAKRM